MANIFHTAILKCIERILIYFKLLTHVYIVVVNKNRHIDMETFKEGQR